MKLPGSFSQEVRRPKSIPALCVALFLFAFPVNAQTIETPTPQTASDHGGNGAPEKHHAVNLKWGFEQRTRWENWNNVIDFNAAASDQRNQVRFRNRAWLSVPLHSTVELFVGLANEFKVQTTPEIPTQADEVLFENLYLDFKKLFTPQLSLRVGRQNIFRGEGFVLADGTSGDGSRSTYFNAVDLSYEFRKSELELIGILDPRQERFLPVIHDQSRYLTETDEQAIGVYYTDHNLKSTALEGYYFLKKELNDYRSPSNSQFRPDRNVNTMGGRVVHRFGEKWTAAGEYARQWGKQYPNSEVRAWGGYGTLKRTFQTKLNPYAMVGYWAMSGDDPRTPASIEGWDPIFSRWPKWGDLTLYSYIPEEGVGYTSNDRFSQLEAGISPIKRLSLRGSWYHHDAFHPRPAGTTIFGLGTYRGELLQFRGDIVLSENLRGHVLYERFLPGDFYQHHSSGSFFRMEMSYSFQGSFALKRTR